MIKLRECPFCGCNKLQFEDVGVEGEFEDWGITCPNCHAFYCHSENGEISTKRDVAKHWNKRASTVRPVGEVAE